MLYNICTGIYKFGNNTYPRRIRCRSNLGHIFREKIASCGPENTVLTEVSKYPAASMIIHFHGGNSSIFRNVCMYSYNYTASQSRKQWPFI